MTKIQLYTQENILHYYWVKGSDDLEYIFKREYSTFFSIDSVQKALKDKKEVICTIHNAITGEIITRKLNQIL